MWRQLILSFVVVAHADGVEAATVADGAAADAVGGTGDADATEEGAAATSVEGDALGARYSH